MNPEEDEVDLQLDFYRSDEDSSASEGIDVAFRGEVNDDSGGDDGSDNGVTSRLMSMVLSEWTWNFVYLISFQDFLIMN